MVGRSGEWFYVSGMPASPTLLLAPMQRVTDYPFMKVMAHYGGPDLYVTEYFRVHVHSTLEPYILKSIDENPTGRPIYAQMIGQDIPSLVRSAKELMKHNVVGVDLNLGCPAPIVYRKDAGGGLLRKPEKIREILAALREVVPPPFEFTVKTRVGFETEGEFDRLLEIFSDYEIDALAVHGRTVRERYQTPVHHAEVRRAAEQLTCPVYANGNVVDVATGLSYLQKTGAQGLMIGRGAIRNPWLFSQLRAAFRGDDPVPVTRAMVLDYITRLWEETAREFHAPFDEVKHVHKMKRYLNYIVQGVEPEFEHTIRRVQSRQDFFSVCETYLQAPDLVPPLPPENSKLFCGFSDLLEGESQEKINVSITNAKQSSY